jgi:CRP/FNR family transcriptional regulator
MDKAALLRRSMIFSDLDDRELEELQSAVKVRSFDRKDIIFREGEAYRGFFVVAEGLVLVYKLSAEGKMLILHIRQAGDTFAEVPLFAGGPYPASAQAAHPTTVLFFPKEAFEAFLDAHPAVCRKMLTAFARRLREMSHQLEQVTLHEVSGRVARYVLGEVERQERPDPVQPLVRLPVSKGALAAHLGTTLETLSRTLHRLSEDGILRVRGSKVFVCDLRRLRELAR